MTAETGESTASIHGRADDASWPNILSALRDGGYLMLTRKIDKAVLHCLDKDDPRLMKGRTITISRCRRLAREGVLIETGVDRFEINRAHSECLL